MIGGIPTTDERCPYCSFQPESSNDFCVRHRHGNPRSIYTDNELRTAVSRRIGDMVQALFEGLVRDGIQLHEISHEIVSEALMEESKRRIKEGIQYRKSRGPQL